MFFLGKPSRGRMFLLTRLRAATLLNRCQLLCNLFQPQLPANDTTNPPSCGKNPPSYFVDNYQRFSCKERAGKLPPQEGSHQLRRAFWQLAAPVSSSTAGRVGNEAVGKTLAGNIFQLNCCKHAKQLLMAVHTYVFKTV